MGGTEERYIREAFEKNWIAPLGENVDKFEQALSEKLDGSGVAVVNAGTAAMHLALILLGVGSGDEVLVSDFTFIGTVNPILYQGAIPVFIDSSMKTWNMDPALLEEAITDRMKKGKKPKAIVVVDIYGMPAEMDRIGGIAEKYGIPLVEDAAESLGSSFDGRPCGTFGAMGVLSFNGNKIITTSGGGALVSRNHDVASRARFLASQAREEALHFEHSAVGYNYRMSNILAGIGRGQMEVLDQRVAAHRANNEYYRNALGDISGLVFQTGPDGRYFSNYWLTTILFTAPGSEDAARTVCAALGKEKIDSRPVMKPMHQQSFLAHWPAYLNGVADTLFAQGLCLPSGSMLKESDLERITGIVRKAILRK